MLVAQSTFKAKARCESSHSLDLTVPAVVVKLCKLHCQLHITTSSDGTLVKVEHYLPPIVDLPLEIVLSPISHRSRSRC